MSQDKGRVAPPEPEAEEDPPPPQISTTQVVVGALTAMTTTVLLSLFGTVGTVLGAALGSTLSVLGNYVYSRSIHSTKKAYRKLPEYGVKVPLVHPKSTAAKDVPTTVTARVSDTQPMDETRLYEPDHTAVMPAVSGAVPPDPTGPTSGVDAVPALVETAGAPPQPARRPPNRKRVIVTILIVFLTTLAGVTVLELAMGRPISGVLHNEQGSGTTIFGNESATPTSTTTVEVTVTTTTAPTSTPTTEATVPTVGPTTEAPTSPAVTPTTEAPTTATATDQATGDDDSQTGAMATPTDQATAAP